MPNLIIGKVGIDATTKFTRGYIAVAGDPGTVLYKDNDETPPQWKPGITTTEITAGRNGVAIQLTTTDTALGHAVIATSGNVLMDVSVDGDWTESDTAVLSETAGKIAEESEVTTQNAFKTVLGVKGTPGATTTDMRTFRFQPIPTAYQVP